MKLYSYWRSSSAYRVRIALNVKGVPYEYVPVDILPGVDAQHSEEYARVNPMHEVPTLEWEESGTLRRLTQSVAIIEYIEELHPSPPLLPADPFARALVRQAVQIVNAGTQPLQNSWTQGELKQMAGEAAVAPFVRKVIARGLQALEAHAARHAGRCLVGDAPSMADAYLVPQLYNARRHQVDVHAYPTLLAVESHVSKLPAFLAARPEAQPDARAS